MTETCPTCNESTRGVTREGTLCADSWHDQPDAPLPEQEETCTETSSESYAPSSRGSSCSASTSTFTADAPLPDANKQAFNDAVTFLYNSQHTDLGFPKEKAIRAAAYADGLRTAPTPAPLPSEVETALYWKARAEAAEADYESMMETAGYWYKAAQELIALSSTLTGHGYDELANLGQRGDSSE